MTLVKGVAAGGLLTTMATIYGRTRGDRLEPDGSISQTLGAKTTKLASDRLLGNCSLYSSFQSALSSVVPSITQPFREQLWPVQPEDAFRQG